MPPGWRTTRYTSWRWAGTRSPGRPWPRSPRCPRFENAAGPRALYRMGRTLAATVIAQPRHRRKGQARRITIDLDPTDDPTHGQQAWAFFNGHYDTWCYLPLVATLTFNDEAEQYLVAIVLRPWTSPAKRGAAGLLRTLLRRLRWGIPGNDWLDCWRRAGRVCRGAGQQPASGTARRALAGRGLRPLHVQRPDRAVYGETLSAAKPVAPPPRAHQRRSGPAPGTGSPLQSALRGDQSCRGPSDGIRHRLPARGDGEPAHGMASRAGDGPHEWLAVLGQSVPGVADGDGLCPAAGVAATGPRHGLRSRAGVHAAGAAAQAGRVGRTLGAPHRVAPAPHSTLGHDLATGSHGRGRGTRLTTHPGSCRTVAQRDQTGDVCPKSSAQGVQRPPDHSQHREWGTSATNSYCTGTHASPTDPEGFQCTLCPSVMNNAG